VEGRVGFTADRRVHLSAFGDSAIWAVAVIGSDHARILDRVGLRP
jgi:hypothetical protein